MDFDMVNRVCSILSIASPKDVMIILVKDGLTPERAHVIICAAMVLMTSK